jgi:hypothetical protein
MAVRRRGARNDKVWLSAFSSANRVVRLATGIPWFPDASGVAVQPSFDGQSPDSFPGARRVQPPTRKITLKKPRKIILKMTCAETPPPNNSDP